MGSSANSLSSSVSRSGPQTVQPGIQKNKPARQGFGLDKVFLTLVMLYLLIPLGATLVFGITNDSSSLTFAEFPAIFKDADFSNTLSISLELALATTILTVVLITPTAYWVQMRLPQMRPLMDFLALVPFAVPAIVMAFGLIEVYGTGNPLVNILSLGLVPLLSNNPFNIVNTPPLLVCGYVIVSLPFAYRPIDNSLRAINARVLTEASYSLGGGWWRTFMTVIFPNVLPGVISAALLTFSTAMGEFTLAELFGIYTFPIYMDVTGQNNAHKAALLVLLSFVITLICVLAILFLVRLVPGASSRRGQIDLVAAK